MYETIKKNRVLLLCVFGLVVFCIWLSRSSTPQPAEPVRQTETATVDETEVPAMIDVAPEEKEPEKKLITETESPFLFLPELTVESESAPNAPPVSQNGGVDAAPISIKTLPLDEPVVFEEMPEPEKTLDKGENVCRTPPTMPMPQPSVIVQNVFPAVPMAYPMTPMLPYRPVPVMQVVTPMYPVIGVTVRPCRFVYRANGILILPSNRYATMYFVP